MTKYDEKGGIFSTVMLQALIADFMKHMITLCYRHFVQI